MYCTGFRYKGSGPKTPTKTDDKVQPPPKPAPEVVMVDGPNHFPIADLDQPVPEVDIVNEEQPDPNDNLDQPVPEVQQQNDGGDAGHAPEQKDGETVSDKGID